MTLIASKFEVIIIAFFYQILAISYLIFRFCKSLYHTIAFLIFLLFQSFALLLLGLLPQSKEIK